MPNMQEAVKCEKIDASKHIEVEGRWSVVPIARESDIEGVFGVVKGTEGGTNIDK